MKLREITKAVISQLDFRTSIAPAAAVCMGDRACSRRTRAEAAHEAAAGRRWLSAATARAATGPRRAVGHLDVGGRIGKRGPTDVRSRGARGLVTDHDRFAGKDNPPDLSVYYGLSVLYYIMY